MPTLVVQGDKDQIVPYADASVLTSKLVKNTNLKIYKGYPHGMPTTEADTINRDLLAFIKSLAYSIIPLIDSMRSNFRIIGWLFKRALKMPAMLDPIAGLQERSMEREGANTTWQRSELGRYLVVMILP